MIQQNQAGFEQFPLGPALRARLTEVGYLGPTPIQAAFIPEALNDRDILGQSQTGTGKTAAFLIPILERLGEHAYPQAIVLGPTRELVQQVYQEAVKLCGDRKLQIAVVYGGQHMQRQINQLQAGADLVVGTPGRILDMIRRRVLRLDRIQFAVLDEADRMLDIGFRPDIERILRQTPESRKTWLLSATIPEPVERLARRFQRDPVMLKLSKDEYSVDTIDQHYVTVEEEHKLGVLLRLLVRERPRQCIIFCQRKSSVRRLAAELGRRIRGVMAMRGDMPQGMRNTVMQEFRDGRVRILVATDVVGRGIDVQGISHVINYDIPEDPEAYVHRVGRTGRMGKDGKSYTLVTPEQGRELTIIERFINKQVKPDRIEGYSPAPRRRVTSVEVGG